MFNVPFRSRSQTSVFKPLQSAASGLAVAAILAAEAVQAAPMVYTDRSTFDAAISGMISSTLDFDGETAGTLITDGDTLDGITFSYPVLAGFGVTMKIADTDETTSSPNYLGTNDGDVFLGGDAFDLGLGPVNAIGMYFITSDDEISDDDLTLTIGATIAGLVESDQQMTLSDNGKVFFLGIVDNMATFTTASIVSFGDDPNGDNFLFTVDDIVTAVVSDDVREVPEPGALALLSVGLAGLGAMRRRRRTTT